MEQMESSRGLYGKDLKTWFTRDASLWDEPGGGDPVIAVVPESRTVERWAHKAQAWASIEEQIGKRAVSRCKCLEEAVWRYLGKVPFELFIGDTAEGDSERFLLLTDNFGSILRNEVRLSGLSMKRLAEDSEVNRVSLSRFMDGKTDLSLAAASRLARHFGLVLVHESQVKKNRIRKG